MIMGFYELSALFVVSYLAATLSGAVGFGGALLLLPLLNLVIDIKVAVPILTVAQIFGNASRVWFGRKQLRWEPITLFLLGAVPCAVAGALLFYRLESRWLSFGLGILLLLLVVQRRLKPARFFGGRTAVAGGGALTGFLSAVAGSAGPLGAAVFLSLGLTPTAYIASEAFTALTLHLVKVVSYQRLALLDYSDFMIGCFLGVAMVLGSWSGKKIVDKIPKEKWIILVELLLVVSAMQLIASSL